MLTRLYAVVVALVGVALVPAEAPKPLKILFLGDNGHHRPAERFRQLRPVMAARGIELTYTERMDDLNPKTLAGYDGLLIYANTTKISPEQEKALLDFVEGGKGLIPLHCASYCFLNSPKYVALVGAQFLRHGTGTFRTVIAAPDHPVMKGFHGFESWDETYVHTKHNEKDRTVLAYREDNGRREPWTWVRTQGKGRVFYTAWGHDERPWGNPGFQNLVERGIRWACGQDPAQAGSYSDPTQMTIIPSGLKPFEYVPAEVPFYPAGQRWGTVGENIKRMQKPLPAAESMKHYVHPADLEMQLFADETLLGGGKPICMAWDEQGRLWVVLTVDYPNNKLPDGQGHDRIVILEDTDHDGRADKVTVFAEKLSIPTSLVFANGGVIVHAPPQTLFLKDTDGDGKADVRKELFRGWGIRDTHAGPSNLRYGPDNWIYGIVGYSAFNGTVGGVRHRFGQGFYRFKPDGSKMEFLRSTSNNSWGVGFSEEGLLFGSTANGCPSVFMPIPNRYYEAVRGWSPRVLQNIAPDYRFHPITDKVRQVDFHGGFTAAAGHALYTARAYPKEYWNRTAFVSDPTGHLTATFVLQPDGAGFSAHYGWNLLAADDEWAAPIAADVGPDGCVWAIDWYNFIVQHNPTPQGFRTGRGSAYVTPLRDKKYSRIYRLVPKGYKPQPFTLKDASPEKLVATLKNPTMLWRLHAQRLLVERGQRDVVPALLKLIADPSVDEIGLNVGAIHALWTLDGLGAVDGNLPAVAAALKHPSAGVRRNAVAVLPRSADGQKALLAAGPVRDVDPQVRLAAFLALADMPPSPEAAAAVVDALGRPENSSDRWLTDALTSAAATHDRYFLKAIASAKATFSQRALRAVSIVAEHFARKGPVGEVGEVISALAEAPLPVAESAIAGLAKGWPRDHTAKLDEAHERALATLVTRLPASSRGTLLKLSQSLGSKGLEKYSAEIARALTATIADEKQSDEQRLAAARQLAELRSGDAATVEQLLNAITPQSGPALAAGLIEAAGNGPPAAVAAGIIKRYGGFSPTARAAALRVLLSRPASAKLLLDAIDGGKISFADLTLDQRQALAAHPNRALAQRAKKLLARGGGLPNVDRQKVVEQFMAVTTKAGDAVRGKALFTKHCATCHRHGAEGNNVGPDLTGMAAHPKSELLISILDPSRSVEGNFRVYTVTTKDGRVLSGLLASETKTSIEIVDAQAKRHVLLREDVDELIGSNKSLMPDGFEKQMSAAELTDLLAFLTQRGKYLPLPLDRVATVVSTRGMFYSEDAEVERLIFADWSPKTFAGVPFQLVNPQNGRVPNAVMLYSPQGKIPPKMPRSVSLPVNAPTKAIHLLSGVSGWGFPYSNRGSVSLIVRLHYADGQTEDHPLRNGEVFADYIRRVDVPGSQFAFNLRGRQIRYLVVTPKRAQPLAKIEFVKGSDITAPVILAVTVEGP